MCILNDWKLEKECDSINLILHNLVLLTDGPLDRRPTRHILIITSFNTKRESKSYFNSQLGRQNPKFNTNRIEKKKKLKEKQCYYIAQRITKSNEESIKKLKPADRIN